MSVVLELASTEEKNVISSALAIGLVATEGIGEWKSTREVMLAVFERMRPDFRLKARISMRLENCWKRESGWGT